MHCRLEVLRRAKERGSKLLREWSSVFFQGDRVILTWFKDMNRGRPGLAKLRRGISRTVGSSDRAKRDPALRGGNWLITETAKGENNGGRRRNDLKSKSPPGSKI